LPKQSGVHIVHENFNGLTRVLAGQMICTQELDQARLLPLMRAKTEAIIEREGCLRVPKSYGYFVADV
jgi:hypothetical protein